MNHIYWLLFLNFINSIDTVITFLKFQYVTRKSFTYRQLYDNYIDFICVIAYEYNVLRMRW